MNCDQYFDVPKAQKNKITIIIKAASSDGRDLAPGSLPTGGFRKTGNSEQYGETSKFVMPPRTRPLTKTLDLQ